MDGFNGMSQHLSHTGRNVFIVIGAVLIIAGGVFAFNYWPALVAPPIVPLPDANANAPVAQPVTSQEKSRMLQTLDTTAQTQAQTAPTSSPSNKAQVLDSAQTQGSVETSPSQSSDEKMKVLQSLQN